MCTSSEVPFGRSQLSLIAQQGQDADVADLVNDPAPSTAFRREMFIPNGQNSPRLPTTRRLQNECHSDTLTVRLIPGGFKPIHKDDSILAFTSTIAYTYMAPYENRRALRELWCRPAANEWHL